MSAVQQTCADTAAFPLSDDELASPIHTRFEAIVARHPNAIAICYGDDSVTYDGFNRRANRIARWIRRTLGESPCSVALDCVNPSRRIVAYMAILKAGMRHVAIAGNDPAQRIQHLLTDSQAKLLLTDRSAPPSGLPESLNVQMLQSIPDDTDDQNLELPVAADQTAVLNYTSGSSGLPKAAIRSHASFLHVMGRLQSILHIQAGERVSQLSPPTYISWNSEVLMAILNGGTICPFSLGQHGIAKLTNWLDSIQLNYLMCVPTVFRQLVAGLEQNRQFEHIKVIKLGGEPVRSGDLEQVRPHFPQARLFHTFGTTETGFARYHEPKLGAAGESDRIPIGKPFPGIDSGLLPVGDGEDCGEIWLGGYYLADGYWRRPELTEEKFVLDPKRPGYTTYKTGDLARLRPDGVMEHLGRIDDQVKVSGRRIEPATTEVALLRLPSVREAVVVQRTVREQNTLVAYLVLNGDEHVTAESIRQALRAEIPTYAVPKHIQFLAALPITATGKVDRRALPPVALQASTEPSVAIEGGDGEQRIHEIWCEHLGERNPNPNHTFVDCGGSSADALALGVQLATEFNTHLPPASILEHTVVSLTHALRAQLGNGEQGLVPLQPEGDGAPLFCFPGIYGNAFTFAPLAAHLGQRFPTIAIRLPSGDESRPDSIESLSEAIFPMLQKAQSQVPYRLLGYSFGGLVALHVAGMLRDAGAEVELVALCDTRVPRSALQPLSQRLLIHRHQMTGKGTSGAMRHIGKRLRRRLGTAQENVAAKQSLPLDSAAEATRQAAARYQPRPYPGRVIMYRAYASNPASPYVDPVQDWSRFVEDLETVNCPCLHAKLLDAPHVDTLATHLSRVLHTDDQ